MTGVVPPEGGSSIGAVTVLAPVPLPSGASTSALQTTANTTLSGIDAKLGATLTVTGPLTDAQLRASAVPVSISSSALPTGASTAANQSTANTSLGNINTDTTAMKTSLDILDDWDESDRLKTNSISGQAGVEGGAGASTSKTQRVAIATDANAVSLTPTTSGGLSTYRNLDVQNTGAVVKASAGQLYGYFLANTGASTLYVKIYNKATAPSSADTPSMTLPMPPGSAANIAFPNGIAFGTGIGIRAVTGVADANTTSPNANELVANLNYK